VAIVVVDHGVEVVFHQPFVNCRSILRQSIPMSHATHGCCPVNKRTIGNVGPGIAEKPTVADTELLRQPGKQQGRVLRGEGGNTS